MANRLVGQATNLLTEIVAPLEERGIGTSVASGNGVGVGPPDGYRSIIQNASFLHLSFATPGPAKATRRLQLTAVLAVSRDADADLFQLIVSNGMPGASFSLQEVHPTLTGAAEQRLRLVLSRIVAIEIDALVEAARAALTASGYPVSN